MQVSRSSRLLPFAIVCAYAAAALYELPLVRYQINPDGIAYIHAARRWAAGHFAGAINGCYSPLFSWLLVPLIAAGVNELLASKIITFAAGAITVVIVWKLTRHFSGRLSLRVIATIAAAAMLLAWAASLVTPDVLVVMTLCAWLLFLLEPPSTATAVGAGIAGGLMYLAKSYGFPFVVASLAIVTVARWLARRDDRTGRQDAGGPTDDLLRTGAITAAVFLAIAIPWAIAVSVKYRRPTIGTAAAYNIGLIGPLNGPVGSRNHPIRTQGLMAPSDPQAFSASDDLTYHPFPPWPGGRANLRRVVENIAFNLRDLPEDIGYAATVTGALAILLVLIRRPASRLRSIGWTVMIAGVYLAGYVTLIVEPRYVWSIPILMLLVSVAIADAIADRMKVAAAVIAFAGAVLFAWPVAQQLPLLRDVDIEFTDYVRIMKMHGIDLRGHHVASLNGWDPSMYLLYQVDGIYFGFPKPGETDAAIRKELDGYAIDTVLVWDDEAERPQPALLGLKRMLVIDEAPLAVYQRPRPIPDP